jgi:hypothetical protein
MSLFVILLLFFGIPNLLLGLIWNSQRKKKTGLYSVKYRTIWIIGLVEMLSALLIFVSAALPEA